MEQIYIVLIFVVILVLLFCKPDNNENFYFRSPPLDYDADSCQRRCDNTSGCNSFYYDPITRQCWMQSAYKHSDLYYPYVHNTYWWVPSRYRFGKTFGDVEGKYRPKIMREQN
jgi:hypothetical protein